MPKTSFVYIITNHKGGTLYTGVTNNLIRRTYEHKNKLIDGFSKKYHLDKLVYYEIHEDISFAIQREKNIKNWNRIWKIRLIEEVNPNWQDLFYDL